MKRTEKLFMAFAFVLIGVAYCWASHSDYVDSKVVEMKNNGNYDKFYQEGRSEAQMVEMYIESNS